MTQQQQIEQEAERRYPATFHGPSGFWKEDKEQKAFIAGAAFASSWIEIVDGCEMPETPDGEDSKNVLVIEGGVLQVMAWCWIEADENSGWAWCNCNGDINGDPEFDDNYYPTHWMPLPQPPIINQSK